MAQVLTIIGISDAGLNSLNAEALKLLQSARFIAGGARHLEFVQTIKAEKFTISAKLADLVQILKARLAEAKMEPVVVLASGDPLFFGIAKTLSEKLEGQALQILPAPSAMQSAFARIGCSWEDACLVSVHGRPMTKLWSVPADAMKLGIFTDEKNHPGEVAKALIKMGWNPQDRAVVLENLDGADEKITDSSLEEIQKLSFGKLNTMLALRATPPAASAFGFALPETEFFQRKPQEGLITKAEVRAVSLSKMRLSPSAVVWDIGAGSGSVSIEASRLARKGKVWAIEKNAEDCENVRKNIEKFGCLNVEVLEGKAPEALEQVKDDPDAVFIGGSSGKMAAILDACKARLKPDGCVVVNTITLENTAEALEWFKASGMNWDCLQMQVARRKPILDLQRLEGLNPIFIFWAYC